MVSTLTIFLFGASCGFSAAVWLLLYILSTDPLKSDDAKPNGRRIQDYICQEENPTDESRKLLKDAVEHLIHIQDGRDFTPLPKVEVEITATTCSLYQLERTFDGFCLASKDRAKQLKFFSFFVSDVGRTYASFAKDLLKLSVHARSNVKAGDQQTNPAPNNETSDQGDDFEKASDCMDEWWKALSLCLGHLASDNEELSELMSGNCAAQITLICDYLVSEEKKLVSEGTRLLTQLKDGLIKNEHLAQDRDKWRMKVSSSAPTSVKVSVMGGVIMPQQPLDENGKKMLKLQASEHALSENMKIVQQFKSDFRAQMPRIFSAFRSANICFLMNMKMQLMKVADVIRSCNGNSDSVTQRLKSHISATSITTGEDRAVLMGFEPMLQKSLAAIYDAEESDHTKNSTIGNSDSPAPPHLDMTLESTACLAASAPAILPALPPSFRRAVQEETCVWFNAFSGRIYRDAARSDYFHSWLLEKLTTQLNKGTKPGFIDEVVVESVTFGATPPLLFNVKWSPPVVGLEKKGRHDPTVAVSANSSEKDGSEGSLGGHIDRSVSEDGGPVEADVSGKDSSGRGIRSEASRPALPSVLQASQCLPHTTLSSSPYPSSSAPHSKTSSPHSTTPSVNSSSKISNSADECDPSRNMDSGPSIPNPFGNGDGDDDRWASDDDIECTADMAYRSGLKFKITTRLWCNWPRDRYASIPVTLTLELVEISGRVRFGVTHSSSYFTFLDEPHTRFAVHSEVGGDSFKFKDIPTLSNYIVKKLKDFILKKFVDPSTHSFRLIWPRSWWPVDVQEWYGTTASTPAPVPLAAHSADAKTDTHKSADTAGVSVGGLEGEAGMIPSKRTGTGETRAPTTPLPVPVLVHEMPRCPLEDAKKGASLSSAAAALASFSSTTGWLRDEVRRRGQAPSVPTVLNGVKPLHWALSKGGSEDLVSVGVCGVAAVSSPVGCSREDSAASAVIGHEDHRDRENENENEAEKDRGHHTVEHNWRAALDFANKNGAIPHFLQRKGSATRLFGHAPRVEGGPKEGGPKEGGPKEGGPKEGGPKEGGPKEWSLGSGPIDGVTGAQQCSEVHVSAPTHTHTHVHTHARTDSKISDVTRPTSTEDSDSVDADLCPNSPSSTAAGCVGDGDRPETAPHPAALRTEISSLKNSSLPTEMHISTIDRSDDRDTTPHTAFDPPPAAILGPIPTQLEVTHASKTDEVAASQHSVASPVPLGSPTQSVPVAMSLHPVGDSEVWVPNKNATLTPTTAPTHMPTSTAEYTPKPTHAVAVAVVTPAHIPAHTHIPASIHRAVLSLNKLQTPMEEKSLQNKEKTPEKNEWLNKLGEARDKLQNKFSVFKSKLTLPPPLVPQAHYPQSSTIQSDHLQGHQSSKPLIETKASKISPSSSGHIAFKSSLPELVMSPVLNPPCMSSTHSDSRAEEPSSTPTHSPYDYPTEGVLEEDLAANISTPISSIPHISTPFSPMPALLSLLRPRSTSDASIKNERNWDSSILGRSKRALSVGTLESSNSGSLVAMSKSVRVKSRSQNSSVLRPTRAIMTPQERRYKMYRQIQESIADKEKEEDKERLGVSSQLSEHLKVFSPFPADLKAVVFSGSADISPNQAVLNYEGKLTGAERSESSFSPGDHQAPAPVRVGVLQVPPSTDGMWAELSQGGKFGKATLQLYFIGSKTSLGGDADEIKKSVSFSDDSEANQDPCVVLSGSGGHSVGPGGSSGGVGAKMVLAASYNLQGAECRLLPSLTLDAGASALGFKSIDFHEGSGANGVPDPSPSGFQVLFRHCKGQWTSFLCASEEECDDWMDAIDNVANS